MPDFEDMDFATPEEEREFMLDIVKTGLRFLAFTSLWYGFIVWTVLRALEANGIISGNLNWVQSCMIAFLVTFSRMWDRTFFR